MREKQHDRRSWQLPHWMVFTRTRRQPATLFHMVLQALQRGDANEADLFDQNVIGPRKTERDYGSHLSRISNATGRKTDT